MTTKLDDITYEVLSEEFSEYDLSFKIIVVGDSGVGKSCLTMKGTKNHFEECYSPTVGFEFFTFNIRINDKNCINWLTIPDKNGTMESGRIRA